MPPSPSKPSVSVVIPVFNAEKDLSRCIESLLKQTLSNIEILCVDDGSTDNSLMLLNEYAEKHSNIRVFTQENQRQGVARNLALTHAEGEYVAFLDADDEFVPNALERLWINATSRSLDMLMFSCVRVSPSGRESRWGYHNFSKFLPEGFPKDSFSWRDCSPQLFWRMPCSCWGTIYSRKFLERNGLRFPEKIFFEDRPFFFFAFLAAAKVGILDEALYRYWESPTSTIAGKGKHLDSNIEQGMMILRRLRGQNFPKPMISEGLSAFVHDLLKSLGLCPRDILERCREKLLSAFAELFPEQDRNSLIPALVNAQDKACVRALLGIASFGDYLKIRLFALKYLLLAPFVRGERRQRYIEKSGMAWKILSVMPRKRKPKEKFYLRSRFKLFGLIDFFKIKENGAKNKRRYYFLGLPVGVQSLSAELAERERGGNALSKQIETLSMISLPAFALHQEVFPKYRNIHKGRDIVIVGAGPTLDDYVPISDAIHIGVNKTFLCEKLQLDYLFIQDCFEDIQEAADLYRGAACKKFYGYHPNNAVCAIPVRSAENANAERYFFEDLPLDAQYPFPPDISCARLGTFSSIIFPALQFALWTHPRRIYLVGCDCSSLGHCLGIKSKTSAEMKFPLATERLRFGWEKMKMFINRYYPDVEIVSINPVGLKGMFKDQNTLIKEEL